MTAGVAPEPGSPILPDQLQRRVQREGQALADQMFAAAGDPARMRAALQAALDRTGASFGGTTVVALQALSTTIANCLPGAVPPTSHYNTEEN